MQAFVSYFEPRAVATFPAIRTDFEQFLRNERVKHKFKLLSRNIGFNQSRIGDLRRRCSFDFFFQQLWEMDSGRFMPLWPVE